MGTPNVDRYAADQLRKSDQSVLRVTAAITLNPGDENVVAVVPLAAADTYNILLPPVGSCPGAKFWIKAERASGVYVDGEVVVKGQDKSITGSVFTADGLTATNDHLYIINVAGQLWHALVDVTT